MRDEKILDTVNFTIVLWVEFSEVKYIHRLLSAQYRKGAESKIDTATFGGELVLTQSVEEWERVFAARQTDQHSIAVLNHVECLKKRKHTGREYVQAHVRARMFVFMSKLIYVRPSISGFFSSPFPTSIASAVGL